MKPLDYFYDTPAEGSGHYPQRFCTFISALVRFFFSPFRLKVYDVEQVGQSQAFILAGNHRSYLDPLFIMMALRPRPARFMAKDEFFSFGPLARGATWCGAFPVKRDTADMKAIKRSTTMLKRGELVGIFPEGSRGRGMDEEELRSRKVHEGVAVIARLSKAAVIPVRLWGTELISPPGTRLWRFPRITVRFGKPLSLDDPRYEKLGKEERIAAFTDDIMQAIYALENPRDSRASRDDGNPRNGQDALPQQKQGKLSHQEQGGSGS